MTLSKKQALIIGAAVIGGAGLGLMVLGEGDKGNDNGGKEPETKKEMMIRYDAPVYAPSEVYAPYTESNITEIIHNVITRILPPEDPTPPGTPPVTPKTPSQIKVPQTPGEFVKKGGEEAGLTPGQATGLETITGLGFIFTPFSPFFTAASGEDVSPSGGGNGATTAVKKVPSEPTKTYGSSGGGSSDTRVYGSSGGGGGGGGGDTRVYG